MAPSEGITELTRDFLRDHPDVEPELSELIEIDNESSSWTFDDIPLDSGRFGELVSRNIVTKTDNGEYRLRNSEAVQAALSEPGAATERESTPSAGSETEGALGAGAQGKDWTANVPVLITRTVSRLRGEIGWLFGALVLFVYARIFIIDSVFRDGHVVSPANDPYFYRYWQAQLLERSNGPTDLSLLADMGGATSGRPLAHAANWWFTELLGGTQWAADVVAAWLPVAGAVVAALFLYGFVKLLTDDVRVGVLTVLFVGVAPTHVVYTTLGFLEHRVHQYFWLVMLVLTLAWLAFDVRRRRGETKGADVAIEHAKSLHAWGIAGVLAIAVAASAHVYGGSPITFVPVCLYVALRVPADIRAGVSPLYANLPMLGGISVGAVVAAILHFAWGWHSSVGGLMPLLVAGGTAAVLTSGVFWQRKDRDSVQLLVVEGGVAVAGLLLFRVVHPSGFDHLLGRIGDLLTRTGASETTSLFALESFIVLEPIVKLGFWFFPGVLALGWATRWVYRTYSPEWLLVICFTWWYLLMASLQGRFTAQFTLLLSIFGAIGTVWLLAKIDLVRPVSVFKPLSDRVSIERINRPRGASRGLYISGAIILLLSVNLIFVPSLTGQTEHDDEVFEATMTISAHADSVDRDYPENFVLSRWGANRMHNYFVNGESRSYGYARGNYIDFLASEDPDLWRPYFADEPHELNRSSGQSVGYVVVDRRPFSSENAPTYATLFNRLGAGEDSTAVGHYQPIYVGERIRAFAVVEGATIHVTDVGENATEVTAATELSILDQEIPYERTETVTNGTATIRVANPGEYTVENRTVEVDRSAVYDGEERTVSLTQVGTGAD